jgi:type IV pilus assembly protein PilC
MHLLHPPGKSPDARPRSRRRSPRLSFDELLQLTQQLDTLLRAGIALPFALQIFREGQRRPAVKALLNTLEFELAQGQSLSYAFSKFPATFNNLYQRLVAVGESSGTLEDAFHHLATLLERKKRLQQKIRSALIHPLAILGVASVVSALLLLRVVPEFQQMFARFDRDLPTLTLAIIDASQQLQTHGTGLLVLLLGFFSTIRYGIRRYEAARLITHKGQLLMPVVGQLVMHKCIANIARTLATSLSAGLPMMEALEFARHAPENIVYARGTAAAAQSVQRGSNLCTALQNTHCFPPLFIQMVAVGEQAGMLDSMLLGAALHYETLFETAIDRLIPLLEPAMMVTLGGLIGMLLLAMYLPLFQMGSVFG